MMRLQSCVGALNAFIACWRSALPSAAVSFFGGGGGGCFGAPVEGCFGTEATGPAEAGPLLDVFASFLSSLSSSECFFFFLVSPQPSARQRTAPNPAITHRLFMASDVPPPRRAG